MKILIDCGNYFVDNNNNGDKAIYKVMINRLTSLWPDARIKFITLDPELIRRDYPDAEPFILSARHHWQFFPPRKKPCQPVFYAQSMMQSFCPKIVRRRAIKRMRRNAVTSADAEPLIRELKNSDLVLASGGGWFSDAFARHAMGILDTLEAAVELGKPAAIMSCGFERIESPYLNRKAHSVLPRLNLIACRENAASPKILRSFGVQQEKILVSGDDAVEIAYETHTEKSGKGIGINLRVAEYSGITEEQLVTLRTVLQKVSRKYDAPLLPVPISLFGPSDPDTIKALLSNHPGPLDGGANLDTPEKTIRKLGQCRLLVTGSYHAAVFALSKGIPVIAISGSQHYHMKLTGLADMFGGKGCVVLASNGPELPELLFAEIDNAWTQSKPEKNNLLSSAKRQVDSGRLAYEKLYDVVASTMKASAK